LGTKVSHQHILDIERWSDRYLEDSASRSIAIAYTGDRVANRHAVSVALTFDFDALSPWLNLGWKSPSSLSRGEMGPIGVRRLLPLLDEYGALSTWFVPGHTALAYPSDIEAILDAGHEIGHHGWVHETPMLLSIEDERMVLEKGFEALSSVGCPRPVGYRAPGWQLSQSSIRLLIEAGFEYDSSQMGRDYELYRCRDGDRVSASEPYIFGNPSPLVEVPVSWHMDDAPFFDFVADKPSSGLRAPSEVLEIWTGEFDYLYDELGKGLLVLTLHPQVIGRGHRMMMFRRFLDYLSDRPDVVFVRCLDYVREWREAHPLSDSALVDGPET
jgi:peptidoglycan-N-acetylglucosamine deacetylase